MSIPRPEYPRPQLERTDWLCLNGEWEFEVDGSDTGLERGLPGRKLRDRIVVPFCPESALSGIGNTDFMRAVWYRRLVSLPREWAGRRVLLNFQACDYDTTVWVNGSEAGRHRGGFTPFFFELPLAVSGGSTVEIVVRARDDSRQTQPSGKQSSRFGNWGCHYTRTTGIWQTVWMEPVPEVRLNRPRVTPDAGAGRFLVALPISNSRPGWKVRAVLKDMDGIVSSAAAPADSSMAPAVVLDIPADKRRLWAPGSPFLYGLEIELLDAEGKVLDSASSYAGLRCVAIDGKAVKINGRPVFQRLVLDQGYYPDGIMTAPSDLALVEDIKIAMEAGFNGARLHQKVFEERFLYHADKLGYLVWGEYGDWGFRGPVADGHRHQPAAALLGQWAEVLLRDYSHPSIIGWCPLNESHQPLTDEIVSLNDATHGAYWMTKAADPTRPVLDASGYAHLVPGADVYDSHDYDQNPATFSARHEKLGVGEAFVNLDGKRPMSVPYRGQPYFVSEFGGIWWNPKAAGEDSWGYGERPRNIEEFYSRFEGLCAALLDNPDMFGYCYTQLTDVFQEQNGVVYFDRSRKFDPERLRKVQQKAAAIEKGCIDGRRTF